MSGTLFSNVNNITAMIPEEQKNITTHFNYTEQIYLKPKVG